MNLYVHYPFCRVKCAYCALLSRAGRSEDDRTEYVRRIVTELSDCNETFDTVYFGGGTPALCDLRPVFDVLRSHLAKDCEFTVELHPLDVTESLLATLKLGGVNRISLGVQSFDDAVLEAMGRGHTADMAADAFRRIKAVFPNAGMDLIAGWPGTDDESWIATVERALSLHPVHMSCYTLIREPKTRLDLAVRKGEVALPDDDEAFGQIDLANAEMLHGSCLRRYEVSNYAADGLVCRHNCAVWRGEDYMGIGEGAHGRLGLKRTIGTASGYDATEVTPEEDAVERALIALRTMNGINLRGVGERFPVLAPRIPGWRKILDDLIKHGIVEEHESGEDAAENFRLTRRGFEVCDAVMAELM